MPAEILHPKIVTLTATRLGRHPSLDRRLVVWQIERDGQVAGYVAHGKAPDMYGRETEEGAGWYSIRRRPTPDPRPGGYPVRKSSLRRAILAIAREDVRLRNYGTREASDVEVHHTRYLVTPGGNVYVDARDLPRVVQERARVAAGLATR